MERKLEVGCSLIYIDPLREKHVSVVTAVWKNEYPNDPSGFNPPEGAIRDGVNLVYVSSDPQKMDTYGRQIERQTSIVHRSMQPAPGGANSWCWPDE